MDILDNLLRNKTDNNVTNLEKDVFEVSPSGISILVLFEGKISNSLKYNVATLFNESGVKLKQIKQVGIPVEKKIASYFKPTYEKDIIEYSKGCDVCITIGNANYFACKGDGNLNVWNFIDVFLNPSYYWSSLLSLVTFPCFSIGEQSGSTWKTNHFKEQVKRIIENNYNMRWYNEPDPIIKVLNNESFKLLNKTIIDEDLLSIDIETTGFDFRKDDILNIAFSFDGVIGYVVPWRGIDIDELNSFLSKFNDISLSNGKFDTKFLRYRGVKYEMTFDTLLAGHLLNEERSNSLKTHAHIYTTLGGYEEELEEYKRNYNIRNYGDIPTEILYKYAGLDPIVTWRVTKKQKKELSKVKEIEKLYYEIALPCTNSFVDIEMNGMYVDWDRMEEARQLFNREISRLDKEMVDGLLNNTNLELDELVETRRKSTMSLDLKVKEEEKDYYMHDNRNELSRILSQFVDIDTLEPDFLNSKGEIRTNETTLNHLIKSHPELKPYLMRASLLTSYRLFLDEKVNKGMNRYRQSDDKVHPSYSVMLATTHRYKCREPNVQQIPSNSAAGKDAILSLRRIFTVPNEDDYLFAEVDFASFQLRIGTIYSQDDALSQAWINGDDLHTTTLRNMKYPDLTLDELVKLMNEDPAIKFERTSIGKTSNFGFFFGMSAFTAYTANIKPVWSERQLEEYIKEKELEIIDFEGKPNKGYTVASDLRESFFSTYSGLRDWIASQKEIAIRQGYVMSSFGSRKLLTELKLSDDKERAIARELKHLLNICVNAPVQAFESAHLSSSIVFITNKIKELKLNSRLVGAIHDSLLLYIHKEEKDVMKNIILEATTKDRPEFLGIPIRIEGDLSDMKKGGGWKNGSSWIMDTDVFNNE